MRAWVFAGDRRMQLESRSLPLPGPHDVRIRVAFAGICGSDIHGYAGESGFRQKGAVMGHEASGIVDALGSKVDTVVGGEHVTFIPTLPCDGSCGHPSANRCEHLRIVGVALDAPGAFADYVVVPADRVRTLGSIPLELGSMIEPLSVGLHAARQAGVRKSDRVLVLGGGMIGLASAIAAKQEGAADVVVSDPIECRRRVSEKLGLAAVEPAVLDGELFDCAIDAVGIPATVTSAIQAVRRGGRVSLVGLGLPRAEITMFDVVGRERILVGSAAYTDAEFDETLTALGAGRMNLSALSRRQISFDQLGETLEELANGAGSAVKVTLRVDVD